MGRTLAGVEDALDAEAAARVLRRAHELAEVQRPMERHDGGGVSGQALVEAAGEVGIDPDSVRDALALERFGVQEPDPGLLDRLAGPASIPVEHVVHRSADVALKEAEAWLTVTHRMRCVQLPDGQIECRPRGGWVARLGRSVASATGDVNITDVERITVAAQPLLLGATPDNPRTLVRVVADRRRTRRRRLGVGAVAGVGGVSAAAAGLAGAAGAIFVGPIIAVPLIAGGYVVARSGARHADEVEHEMQRVLTAVDRAERPVGLVGRAARRARSVVNSTRD